MSIRLSSTEIKQLEAASKIISDLLTDTGENEEADIKRCSECFGTCKGECTGCQTCKNTSKSS